MSSKRSFDARGFVDKGLWTAIILIGGYCIVTMVLVPLLALTAGGYLAATGQYVLATLITPAGGALAYWLYRQRTTDHATHE